MIRTAVKEKLHPRNRFRAGYDFRQLMKSSPALAPFVGPHAHGDLSIDFANPDAVKALNQALLKETYGLDTWDLPAGYLSAGQRRRLSIARLVAVQRAIWLLDEPTSSLDVPSQTRLAELMREHLGKGGMIIAAVHGAVGIERARELKLGSA